MDRALSQHPAISAELMTAYPGAPWQHIPRRYPTRDELVNIAWIWDETARWFSIEYAFVGTIAALLWERIGDKKIHEMEIVVKAETLANQAALFAEILNLNPTLFLREPGTHRMLIVVNGTLVIPMTFIATNSDNYPNQLIPPANTPFRMPWHGNLPANVRFMALDYRLEYRRSIPYVNFRDLLQQRILRFTPTVNDLEVERRNVRDIDDIKAFLRGTALDGDEAFPVAMALTLQPTIVIWLQYAIDHYKPPTAAMIIELNRLGLLPS